MVCSTSLPEKEQKWSKRKFHRIALEMRASLSPGRRSPITSASMSAPHKSGSKSGICRFVVAQVYAAEVSADAASLDAWKEDLASATASGDRAYRWPLGDTVTVEIRFLGPGVGPSHIDLLRQYLELFRRALC